MKKQWSQWLGSLLLAVLCAVAAAQFNFFPGDVALARGWQSLVGDHVGWAKWLTSTVNAPLLYVLLALTAGCAWRLGGWRGALALLLAYLSLWQAEPVLKAWVARPRPAATLVHVVGTPAGYSFPSGFGLIYFALFGTLLLLVRQRLRGGWRRGGTVICALLLLIGGSARVALGAHWPSDLVGAYLIGWCWVWLLLNVLGSLRRPAVTG